MPVVRALIVLLTACALWVLAPPASAGGPTSVFLSVPGEGRTAALYYTDAEYDELTLLVGASTPSGAEGDPGQGIGSGRSVTVTWLVHDVQPWRLDRIFLDGEGSPWIATQEMTGDDLTPWDAPVRWHQASDGQALLALLDGLGVGRSGKAASVDDQADVPAGGTVGEADSGAVAPATPVEPAAEEQATAAPAAETSALDGVAWGVGGLGLGVLLAAGWARLRARRDEDGGPVLTSGEADDADWLEPVSR